MQVENEDVKEIEDTIIRYYTSFKPTMHLLVPPISCLIQHICCDISMLTMDQSIIHNPQMNERIQCLQHDWNSKKWKSVIKHCEFLMHSKSNPISTRNYQIATINYHISSIQHLFIASHDAQVLEHSSHFHALQTLFKSNRDCISESHFLNINQLMQFYANLITIQFQSEHYDVAQEMISVQLFEYTHFRKPFQKQIKSRNWSQLIQFWRHDTSDAMLNFIAKYNSVIDLFMIYIAIQLKRNTFDDIKDIQWIIQYLTENTINNTNASQIYILQSIFCMQTQQWNDAMLMLNKCSVPLSVFMKGWISFHVGDYKTCRKYFKQSAQSLSFGVSQCLNFFAMMCAMSHKYEMALEYLQQSILLAANENDKSLCLFNWIQMYNVVNHDTLSVLSVQKVSQVFHKIKPGCSPCLVWERSFDTNSQITTYRILHVKAQTDLLSCDFQNAQEKYEKLIGLLNTWEVDDEAYVLSVYQEFCCLLMAQKHWQKLAQFIASVSAEYCNDFQLNVVLLESWMQQKQTQKVMKKIEMMERTLYDSDKQTVAWWLRMFSGRCGEMENNLRFAEKNYELATMNQPDCLLSMFYHVNVMVKRNDKYKAMEAAVCWMNFCNIPLNETTAFYHNIMDRGIEKYLNQRISAFTTFGAQHVPSLCANGVVFGSLYKQEPYQLDKIKLIEMSKYCVSEWISAISKISDPKLIETFTMFQKTNKLGLSHHHDLK
eukprot:117598_1